MFKEAEEGKYNIKIMSGYECVENNTILLTSNETVHLIYGHSSTIFIILGIPIVTIVGLFNNFAFLFAIYRVPRMRTITNVYLANLALADAGTLVMIAIRYLWTYAVNKPTDVEEAWENPIGCFFPKYLIAAMISCSVLFVVLVAIERFLAICYPLLHLTFNGKSRAIKLVISTWVLSFGLTATVNSPSSTAVKCYILQDQSNEHDAVFRIYECAYHCSLCIFIFRAIDVGQFFFAVIFTSILYAMIIGKLSGRKLANLEDHKTTLSDTRNAVARLIIINSSIFFLCLLPYKIILMQDLAIQSGGMPFLSPETTQLLSWLGRVTTLINASVNPIVYSLTNNRYRAAFFEAFKLTNCVGQSRRCLNGKPKNVKDTVFTLSKFEKPENDITI